MTHDDQWEIVKQIADLAISLGPSTYEKVMVAIGETRPDLFQSEDHDTDPCEAPEAPQTN
jgi:hypothetical protein